MITIITITTTIKNNVNYDNDDNDENYDNDDEEEDTDN